MIPRLLLPALFLAACTAPRLAPPPATPVAPRVEIVETGVDALLISVDGTPDEGALWVAGAAGTWGRSLDGGATWTMGTVPDADTLQFRDVEALSATEAVLLSIGPGAASRLYTTSDAGATWSLQWTNPEPDAFYDCLAFFDGQNGFAFSDAVGDRLPLVETADRGRSWTPVYEVRVPAARPGEGSYASSGTCAVADGSRGWIVTNGGDGPDRVFRTTDRGATWTAVETPVSSGDGARGLATLAVGQEALYAGLLGAVDGVTLVRSGDGGATWSRHGTTTIDKVYGLAAVPVRGRDALVAVGPGGVDVRRADEAWQHLSDAEMWGVVALGEGRAVTVGRGGRVGLIRF